jgi:hypothetical protein
MWRWTGVKRRHILAHTYIHTHMSTYVHTHIFRHVQICMLYRSHITVIFTSTTSGISKSETTLAEGKRFNLIQFSNEGKITILEVISHKMYKIFITKN